MAIGAYDQMKAYLRSNPVLDTALFQKILASPPFRRASVYDWHEPTVHPPGYFITLPDVYAWFDPIRGMDVLTLEPTDRGDREDAISYTFSRRPVYVGINCAAPGENSNDDRTTRSHHRLP